MGFWQLTTVFSLQFKLMRALFFSFFIFNGIVGLLAQSADLTKELIVCGDNQVIIFDVEKSQDTVPHVVWRWKASEAFDLPTEYRSNFFRTMDECKPVDQGKKILITSSSGGVAFIDRATKKVLFYAYVGNAHSAEFLPNNKIVVAGSTHAQGNRLELFDLNRSEEPLFKDSLYSGHGVVWDEERQLLYALGYDELRAYSLQDWNSDYPKLKQENAWKIPGESGHDLMYLSNDNDKLLLTEHESVWLFDKQTSAFHAFEPLQGKKDVKAVSLHPTTNRLAYLQAEISWWSHHVYLKNPDQVFAFPGVDLYKVRWFY